MTDRQTGLMTARQAAGYLGISVSTLRKLERSGHVLPYRTPGGHRRYSQSMLDEYLQKSLAFSYQTGEAKGTGCGVRPRPRVKKPR